MNKELLIKEIKSLPLEQAEKLLDRYVNARCEGVLNRTWSRARSLYGHATKHRKEQLKKYILNFDEGSNVITDTELVRFFAAIEDTLVENIDKQPESVREFAANVQSRMWAALGNVKPDRRITFRAE